jgi:hypothetical protein
MRMRCSIKNRFYAAQLVVCFENGDRRDACPTWLLPALPFNRARWQWLRDDE